MQVLHLANCYVKFDENNALATLHVLPHEGEWQVFDIGTPDANTDVLRPLINRLGARVAA